MLSWEIVEHGKPLQKSLRETPKPQGTEVLMRITRSGVCHSDLHIWDGYFDLGGGKRFYVKDRGCVPPFTPGHEPFGVVEALGPRAKGVRAGQKKLIYPWIGCGKCAVCKAGQDNYCVSGSRFLGVNRPGAYSTHVLVPDPKYLLDTAGIDDAFAATLACSAVTAYSAANKLPKLNKGDAVAVLGCGGLGLIGMLAGYAYLTHFDPFYHVAFVYGDISDGRAVPTRLHRANLILDVFGGAKAVRRTLERFKAEGRGVLVMLRDGAAGVPVVAIPKADETASGEARSRQWREVGLGAQILKDLGVSSIRLLSFSRQMTYVGLSGFGIEIVSTEPVEV